jgi:hypothetical protein
MPLLYFHGKLLLSLGYDVLLIKYDYPNNEGFLAISEEEQTNWLLEDGKAIFECANGIGTYEETVVIGKSLGTFMMANSMQIPENSSTKLIWLTPLIRNETVRNFLTETNFPSKIIIGTADPHNDQSGIAKIGLNRKVEIDLYGGADHSMEVPNNMKRSMEIIESITRKSEVFLTQK